MKTRLLSLLFALASFNATAGEIPAPIPAAVPLSRDAMQVARILMDRRISKEVQQFAQRTDFLDNATHTEYNDLDVYVFDGVRMLGGDISCSWTTLTVTASAPEPNIFGFGVTRPLSSKIETKSSDSCKD